MKSTLEQKPVVLEKKEPVRLIALSDGLFATVLTLLVLDLKIPDAMMASTKSTAAFTSWIGPHLFSYLLTFLVAGKFWLNHHQYFDRITSNDRKLMGFNLVFLLFIGMLPFSTAAISIEDINSNMYPFFWGIYAANIIIAGIMLSLTWNYAASHDLVTAETTREYSRYVTLVELVTPAVFLISAITEAFFPQFSLGPYTLLIIPLALIALDRFVPHEATEKASVRKTGLDKVLWQAIIILPWAFVVGLAVWSLMW